MTEYIDKAKLKKMRDDVISGKLKIETEGDLIDACPIEDVAPVVHGEWELKSRIYKMFDDVDETFYVECPICHREFYVPYELEDDKMLAYAKEHYPYCNCGAKMSGGNHKNPAANEIIHGRWIGIRTESFIYAEKCSECGYVEKYNIDPDNGVSPNYCPNCSAKMDGGKSQ